MFNVGDRVVVSESYGTTDDENIVGCVGTVIELSSGPWPIRVDLDTVANTVGIEYRTALFSEKELDLFVNYM